MTAAVDWRRKFAKRWIRTIFAEEFVVCDHEFISRRQQKQRRRSMLETWHHPCAGPTNVAALYSQRKLLLETRREFDAKLLQQKMAAMKQLAYGASHEINNPLANIATRAQTLLSDEQNPERQHKLAVIYEQALRAHEMISDLMLFANPPAIQCVNTDLRLWLATIIKEVAPLLEKMVTKGLKIERHRIEIEVRLGPDVRQLNVDPIHLGVALKLLLKNSVEAIRAADRAGKIELRVFRDHDYQINFSVTDDGVGVSERVEPHLFDPFYSSREAGRGLGFGLSKAWRIAELHGGALRFDAQYSPGARFVLQIPQGACAHAFVQKIESIAKPVETPCPASELFEASA